MPHNIKIKFGKPAHDDPADTPHSHSESGHIGYLDPLPADIILNGDNVIALEGDASIANVSADTAKQFIKLNFANKLSAKTFIDPDFTEKENKSVNITPGKKINLTVRPGFIKKRKADELPNFKKKNDKIDRKFTLAVNFKFDVASPDLDHDDMHMEC